jgi:hypothetical protein
MKKQIQKPENWQDFETLCKKLWGEIWGIPNQIKRNGRLGQNQAGVDVYGKPKGESTYWGIQCKGKDEYTNAQLSKPEIDKEIKKAKLFKPVLSVYIIATTANKDASIEEYVRLKDIENQKDSFEIILYCWEDIVDLIEENKDTYNWYVNEIRQKSKHDFEVKLFSEYGKDFLEPKFERFIRRSKLVNLPSHYNNLKHIESLKKLQNFKRIMSEKPQYNFNNVNHSWVELKFEMANTGSSVIEDWKVDFSFEDGITRISDRSTNMGVASIPDFSPMSRIAIIEEDERAVYYRPHENRPLIQKDSKTFKVPILIDPEASEISVSWEILARDFNISGKTKILVKPTYEEKIEIEEVFDESELFEDEIHVRSLIKDK